MDARDALRPFVRRIEHYDIAGRPAGVHVGMPSATVTMVLPLGAPLDLAMPAIGRRAMTSCVSGLHDHPAAIHHDGTQRGIQLALAPLGLAALFGVPASALLGTAVELGDLVGRGEADRLLDRMAQAPGWDARRALIARYLAWRLGRSGDRGAQRPQIVRAWNLLARTGGTARIGDVAADVGWSTRHLAVTFAAAVGAGPKQTARLMRFHRSVTMIAGGCPIADAATRCGFADQAHLTREWGRLAGTTPARWPREDVLAHVREDVLANVQDTGPARPAASTA